MILTKVDVWLEKIRQGWKIEDVPENIRPEVAEKIAEKTLKCNEWIEANKQCK